MSSDKGDRAGVKQRVGLIRGSRDVAVLQSAARPAEQVVAGIEDSVGVRVVQAALGVSDDQSIGRLARAVETLDPEVEDRAREVVLEELEGEWTRAALESDDVRALCAAGAPDAPEPVRGALQDLSTALSVVTGTLALAALTDLRVLVFAIPAVLGMAGILSAKQLAAIWSSLQERLAREVADHRGRSSTTDTD